MTTILLRRWFLVCLALVLTAGLAWPGLLGPAAAAVPQRAVVAVVLFFMALPLNAGAMFEAMRKPKAVLLAVAINFAVLPLAAWPVSWLLPLDLGGGLMIAASVPCTLASAAAWTRRAGGNDTVALLVMMATNVACFLVTPFWLWLTTGAETSVGDGPWSMIQRLAEIVVLPILLAQLVRLPTPVGRWATARKVPLGVLAQSGILLIVFVGAVQSGAYLRSAGAEQIGWTGWAGMLLAVAGIHLAMLWLGYYAARWLGMPREDQIAVAFSGSQKTLMVGIDLATGYYSPLAMLPMVAFHCTQLLTDTVVADRMRAASGQSVASRVSLAVAGDDSSAGS